MQNNRSGPLPSWTMNLLAFGLLIGLVLAVFSWQLMDMDRDLHRNTLARTRMMAAIIEENLANADLATTTIDTLTTSFLRDKARFIEYLHGIDPLQADELAALARETGLLGISVLTRESGQVSGPEGWLALPPSCQEADTPLRYDATKRTALFTVAGTTGDIDCIVVGLDARAILELRGKTALPVLLDNLARLPGIHFLRMEPSRLHSDDDPVRLIHQDNRTTAETRLATSKGELVVGLDASSHVNRLRQLQRQFLLFATLLLILGLFVSWMLYRSQQHDLERTRRFERLLAKEHEAAALGRATATIAHEVRNPLNALSMGLQRLSLESPALDAQQQQLLAGMREAVRRADLIITELQRFTRPIAPRSTPLEPQALLERLLALYRPAAESQGVRLSIEHRGGGHLTTDGDLVAEVVENLLRNSLEAQPQGGFLAIDSTITPERWHLTLTNGGYLLAPEYTQRLGEPYFTTKTRGTGLGLARCRKIAEALGGELHLDADHQHQQLRVSLRLPSLLQAAADTNPPPVPGEAV